MELEGPLTDKWIRAWPSQSSQQVVLDGQTSDQVPIYPVYLNLQHSSYKHAFSIRKENSVDSDHKSLYLDLQCFFLKKSKSGFCCC